MSFQPEAATYDAGVFQWELTTPALGGVGGAANTPLLNLANRTKYLKAHIDAIEAASSGFAPLDSPVFTGNAQAPNVALGDRTAKLATTQFVQDTEYSVVNVNVAGSVNVNLTAVQAGGGVLNFTGALTGNIAVIVPNTAKRWTVINATTGAFTLTLKTAAGTGIAITQGRSTELQCDATNVFDPKTDFTSPAMTGNPTTPTQPAGENSTKVASTAFARQLKAGIVTVNVAGNSDVVLTQAQWGVGLVVLNGILTGNINVIVPAASDQWLFSNQTTGGFTITVRTNIGVGPILTATQTQNLWCDGVDVRVVSGSFDTTYALVRKPTILTPAAASTLAGTTPIIQGNAYYSLYGIIQLGSQFQVSALSNFLAPAWDSGTLGAGISAQPPSGVLTTNTAYFCRCRYQDLDGVWSPWSDAVGFTTGAQAVQAPTITAPANGTANVGDGVTITASAFNMTTGVDTQFSTDWEIWTGAGGTGTLVFSSYSDTTNLNSIAVPAGTFAVSTTYYPRARYAGLNTGVSAWSAGVSFTTANSFATVLSAGSAFGGGYFGGYIILGGQRWALIVSDSGGAIGNGDLTGQRNNTATSTSDGKANTAAYVARGDYSGGNDAVAFVTRYRGGGYSDWYLPSLYELEIIYRTLKPSTNNNVTTYGANAFASPAPTTNYTTGAPAQTAATNFQAGQSDAFASGRSVGSLTYTAGGTSSTYSINFSNGSQDTHGPANNMNYRAVRRVRA